MKFPINHDLHLHSCLSLCSGDAAMTPQAILDFADTHGYDTLCVTDHVWSENCPPAPNGFYAPQPMSRIRQSLPLPQGKTRFLFGAETDYYGGDRFGLTAADMEMLDFVVVPLNHLHMQDEQNPVTPGSPKAAADLFSERLEQLLRLDLPWRKVGLAHLTCGLIYTKDPLTAYSLLDYDRVRTALAAYVKRGAGIELNAASIFESGAWTLGGSYTGSPEQEASLRIYRIARELGARFYLSSDAHHLPELAILPDFAPQLVDALALTDADRFML